jgi:hypothetical protein
VLVFNRMTPDEAALAGVAEDERGFYFRTQNDKANLAPPDKAAWYRMNNVSLDNGDQVGVACPWKWPELFEGISRAKTQAVQRAVAEGQYRKDPRSPQWVGIVVADELGLNPERDRKRITSILKEWVKNKVLIEFEGEDEKRNTRWFVKEGKWIVD